MYEGNRQYVLRCARCNKPFDKESTLKRHGYYCRSRRVGNAPRSRACTSCARGKARCDHKRPQCSRCLARGVDCHYLTNEPAGTDGDIRENDNASAEPWTTFPAAGDSGSDAFLPKADADVDMSAGPALIMPELEWENLETTDLDWFAPDINFTNLASLESGDKALQYMPSDFAPSLGESTGLWDNQLVQMRSNLLFSDITIPRIPTLTPRSIVHRPKVKNGAQRIADLILYTLTSYPLTIQRHKSLPPFIHPRLISSGMEDNDREPLANCISLVHMISAEVQGSRKLFWKMVRLECERLCEEVEQLNRWELLAAMQALSIYVLIRVDEGETEHNNFDFLLIATVTAISKQLSKEVKNNPPSALYKTGMETTWNEWIYEESKRRLCVVYQVVNLLVYFEPAAMCEHPTELILAPLPSRRQLWEASDESAWRAERIRDGAFRSDFGLAANGDLVNLDERQQPHQDVMLAGQLSDGLNSPKNWQEWCSGMDEIGSLVMLAASFISV